TSPLRTAPCCKSSTSRLRSWKPISCGYPKRCAQKACCKLAANRQRQEARNDRRFLRQERSRRRIPTRREPEIGCFVLQRLGGVGRCGRSTRADTLPQAPASGRWCGGC